MSGMTEFRSGATLERFPSISDYLANNPNDSAGIDIAIKDFFKRYKEQSLPKEDIIDFETISESTPLVFVLSRNVREDGQVQYSIQIHSKSAHDNFVASVNTSSIRDPLSNMPIVAAAVGTLKALPKDLISVLIISRFKATDKVARQLSELLLFVLPSEANDIMRLPTPTATNQVLDTPESMLAAMYNDAEFLKSLKQDKRDKQEFIDRLVDFYLLSTDEETNKIVESFVISLIGTQKFEALRVERSARITEEEMANNPKLSLVLSAVRTENDLPIAHMLIDKIDNKELTATELLNILDAVTNSRRIFLPQMSQRDWDYNLLDVWFSLNRNFSNNYDLKKILVAKIFAKLNTNTDLMRAYFLAISAINSHYNLGLSLLESKTLHEAMMQDKDFTSDVIRDLSFDKIFTILNALKIKGGNEPNNELIIRLLKHFEFYKRPDPNVPYSPYANRILKQLAAWMIMQDPTALMQLNDSQKLIFQQTALAAAKQIHSNPEHPVLLQDEDNRFMQFMLSGPVPAKKAIALFIGPLSSSSLPFYRFYQYWLDVEPDSATEQIIDALGGIYPMTKRVLNCVPKDGQGNISWNEDLKIIINIIVKGGYVDQLDVKFFNLILRAKHNGIIRNVNSSDQEQLQNNFAKLLAKNDVMFIQFVKAYDFSAKFLKLLTDTCGQDLLRGKVARSILADIDSPNYELIKKMYLLAGAKYLVGKVFYTTFDENQQIKRQQLQFNMNLFILIVENKSSDIIVLLQMLDKPEMAEAKQAIISNLVQNPALLESFKDKLQKLKPSTERTRFYKRIGTMGLFGGYERRSLVIIDSYLSLIANRGVAPAPVDVIPDPTHIPVIIADASTITMEPISTNDMQLAAASAPHEDASIVKLDVKDDIQVHNPVLDGPAPPPPPKAPPPPPKAPTLRENPWRHANPPTDSPSAIVVQQSVDQELEAAIKASLYEQTPEAQKAAINKALEELKAELSKILKSDLGMMKPEEAIALRDNIIRNLDSIGNKMDSFSKYEPEDKQAIIARVAVRCRNIWSEFKSDLGKIQKDPKNARNSKLQLNITSILKYTDVDWIPKLDQFLDDLKKGTDESTRNHRPH